jgi:hypothetical protein
MSRAALTVIKPDKDAAPAASAKCSKPEEADDYHAVVARLNKTWRVIVCSAGIQWVLQRRAGERHGRARWEGRSFCRTSHALNRLSRMRAGAIDPTAATILAGLPERIGNIKSSEDPATATSGVAAHLCETPPG